MRSIIKWCLGNRAVVLLLGLVVIGGGVASIFKLNQELLPSLSFPAAFIVVQDPGAGPEQVDRDVTRPLAAGLSGLPGAKHVDSTSVDGQAQVIVTFDINSRLKDDLDAVNQRLAQVSLPQGAGKPQVLSFDTASSPSMTYALSVSDGDLPRATREASEVIKPALAGASSLAQVKILGGTESVVEITVDPPKLAASGVSAAELAKALQGASVDVPAGTTISSGKQLPVQVLGGARTAGDLRAMAIGHADGNPMGKVVTLGDVATVAQADRPTGGITRVDGKSALAIQVIRAQDGNAISLSDDVRSRLARLKLDSHDSLTVISDNADYIRSSLNDLMIEGLLGAALAILVIFAFLRSLRGTLVTAVSLPMSVLVALIGTQLAGFSLNVLTLAGLTIAIGRIVDDAIVVLENSYRHLQMGESPRQAALNGTSEVVLAIVSSTLTTVAVFLPIGFMGGFISKLFLPFSLTVTISLLASLVVALTIVPVLVSFLLARRKHGSVHRDPAMVRVYRPVLGWSLGHWWSKATVLVLALALLGGAIVSATKLPVNLFDFGGSDRLNGSVTLPVGTSMAETGRQLQAFEHFAQADRGVKLVQVDLTAGKGTSVDDLAPSNTATITVLTKNKQVAPAVARRLKDELVRLYGRGNADINVESGGGGASNNAFSVKLQGSDPVALASAADMVAAELKKDNELIDVKSGLAPVKPEVAVNVDATKAAARGLTPDVVAQLLGSYLAPQKIGKLGPDGPSIMFQADPGVTTADKLKDLPLGPGLALRDIASVGFRQVPVQINRQNGIQQVSVDATVSVQDTQGASGRAQQRVQKLHLPEGVTFATGGAVEDIGTNFTSMFEAIGIAIAAVFLILVVFFRSLATPFVILLTMPLALIGSLLGLTLFHQSLGLSALLGVLMVFGIVVSNAILLIDFAERARRDGLPMKEALLQAGSTRLRPILMTALATIFALIPVASGASTGGGGGLISQSLAIVVAGGMISSTLLTLVAVPIMYSLLRRRDRWSQHDEELREGTV